jgi:hypothetical protein
VPSSLSHSNFPLQSSVTAQTASTPSGRGAIKTIGVRMSELAPAADFSGGFSCGWASALPAAAVARLPMKILRFMRLFLSHDQL